MSSKKPGGSGGKGGNGSKKSGRPSSSTQRLLDALRTHRINTLTDLRRVERTAASCTSEVDARAFQEPMTAAWTYYVTSNQFLSELRGLTRNYPISGALVDEALTRVRSDPHSNRSWNLAWLCLVKMVDDGLIPAYATSEAMAEDMWGGRVPESEEVRQLAACFEYEWTQAVNTMLRHWSVSPTWY